MFRRKKDFYVNARAIIQRSGEPLTRGDHAEAPRWVPLRDRRTQVQSQQEDFNGLTFTALRHLNAHAWTDA